MRPQATTRRTKMAQLAATTDVRIAAFVLLMLSPVSIHSAMSTGLSDADKTCIGCYGSQGMEKRLNNGDVLSLYVDGDTSAKSVHIAIGCKSCHPDIDLDKHPGEARLPLQNREATPHA